MTRMTRMTRRRIVRAVGVAIGTGLSTAGASAAMGAPTRAVVLAGLGAAMTGAFTAINLGEFNDPAHNRPTPPAGFAHLAVLLVLAILAAGALSCGPGGASAPSFPGAVAPGDSVSLAELVAQPSAGRAVTWSVDPGGGSITDAGVYTAPGCTALVAALGDVDLSEVGQISATDVVHARWDGGGADVTVRLAEKLLGIEVVPSEAEVEVGGVVQFRAVVHYTCHDQDG